jgi:hypothetical protein
MAQRMILHDKRLLGNPPAIVQNTYDVDQTVALQHCVGWVAQYARSVGGLSELLIMCHGFEADWDLTHQLCTGREVGGFGLQLCLEGLTLGNIMLTSGWDSLIKRITVYACAAADTGQGNENTTADGRRFMSELAGFSGAEVIAARDTQIYTYGGSSNAPIDFGQWEGPVYRFDPNTGNRSLFLAGSMN